ncbi:MAG: hypothetical protein K6T68_14540, partial [Alicyclobacillus shizuokensis]|nr:hypothetical protein [Alicyclobacillus shizuokensis]
VCVVLAAAGYPESPRKGDVISFAPKLSASSSLSGFTSGGPGGATGGPIVFHAGTAWASGELKTAGGRVLTVAGVGQTLSEARDAAYRGADGITFADKYLRRDIGRGL